MKSRWECVNCSEVYDNLKNIPYKENSKSKSGFVRECRECNSNSFITLPKENDEE